MNLGDVGLKPVGRIGLGNADRHRLPHGLAGVGGGVGDEEFPRGSAQGLVIRGGESLMNLGGLGHDRIEAFRIKSLGGRGHITIGTGEVGVAGLEIAVLDEVASLPSPGEAGQATGAVHHGGDGEGTGGGDLADTGVVRIRHPDGPGAIDRNPAGIAELSRRAVAVEVAVAGTGYGGDHAGRYNHFADPVVARIRHQQFRARRVQGERLRPGKPGGRAGSVRVAGGGTARHGGDHPGADHDLADLMIARVSDIEVRPGGIHHQAGGRAKAGGGTGGVGAAGRTSGSRQGGNRAGGIDPSNYMIGGVGDIDVAVGIHGGGARGTEGGGRTTAVGAPRAATAGQRADGPASDATGPGQDHVVAGATDVADPKLEGIPVVGGGYFRALS